MKIIVHQGAPCDPPTVNGITFAEVGEKGNFAATVEDNEPALATFDGHPNFAIVDNEDAIDTAFPDAPVEQASVAVVPAADAAALTEAQARAEKAEGDLKVAEGMIEELTTNGEALRSKIGELQAKIDDLLKEDRELLAELQEEAKALEDKKANGALEPTENMKLGKLSKRIDELTAKLG
jgi:predicted RNase H-like nuclease (RuvC/YqgF family)